MNFHCNPEDVLDMTLSNVTLYNAVVPSYNPKEKNKGKRLSGDSKKDVEEFNRLLKL